jgi:hypothetical protein
MNPKKTEELLDGFFDREYYDTLKTEAELYGEYPTTGSLNISGGLPRAWRSIRRSLTSI